MYIRVDIKSMVEELDWLESATTKEIEDEKLVLGEELDEIAHQIRESTSTRSK